MCFPALQPVIFNLRTILPFQSVLSTTLRALERWQSAWHSTPQSHRLGIARYAPEFAILTRKILEDGQGSDNRSTAYLGGVVREDTVQLHEFIKTRVANDIRVYNSK